MPIKSRGSNYEPQWVARRIRDFAVYLLIALLIALGLVWYAYNSDGTKNDLIARWGGLIVNTVILYGYVVKEGRPFWHAWGFWLAIILVLSLHVLVFSVIFQRVEHWSVIWFLFMYPVEIPVLAIVCDWVVHLTGGQPRYRRDTRDK